MNAPHPLQQQLAASQPVTTQPSEESDETNLLEFWDIIVDSRWLIGIVAAAAVVIGGAYAFVATPVYESNLLIQVEDSQNSAKSLLGEAASLFDVKTPASAEMEIIRSRMVIGRAIDSTLLYITARPKRAPIVGDWLARRATELSNPGFLGVGSWVTGSERIKVSSFDIATSEEDSKFTVVATSDGRYELRHPDLPHALKGAVGAPLMGTLAGEPMTLTITELAAKPGAEFELVRHSRLATIERLQESLKLSEKGRQSGVIDATLQDANRTRLTTILNAIGQEYVRQNVERKAAEAQKTLAFLDVQLPQFKKQLDQSEQAYTNYRNQQGTVALDEEAKVILTESVDLQSKLLEAQQKKRELVARFTEEHPAVKTLDDQIRAWNSQIAALNVRVKGMPTVQQDALRLERDVKVNSELYEQLRNDAVQLQLLREGKVGNVRLIDPAVTPEEPVRPKRALTLMLALGIGLIGGVVIALARAAFFRGVRSPQEVEIQTGLSVYSTIPLSDAQHAMAERVAQKAPGLHILADSTPKDVAVEALRSLRTALQFAMLDTTNNRVLITGGTPGIGKSFVSANFSAVMASAGKRVLLIDADMRKGHLNQYFGVSRERGLSELISGSITREQGIRRAVLPNLDVITSGIYPPNPAELLVSGSFNILLDSLSAGYDLVIVDSAPVLVAADTLSIAGHVGVVLLVARAGQTYVGDIHESARRLTQSGKPPTGVVFNALDLSRRHFGKYGYKYGAYNYGSYNHAYGDVE